MHEISLVRSVINSLEEEFSTDELSRMETIHMDIGLLSNIEPRLMHNAFEAVAQAEGKYQEVKLDINVIPIVISCPNCGSESEVKDYKFFCSNCGTPSNNVIKGTEMLISRVTFGD